MKKLIRKILVGSKQEFVFCKTQSTRFLDVSIDKIDLYIHVPFCKTMCPYCPYNRVRYDQKLVKGYFEALAKEIDLYYEKLGRIEIGSIYIGGGTPTHTLDALEKILDQLRNTFEVTGEIAIETTVDEITPVTLYKIKQMGVSLLSVGVQSFHNKYLKVLGRRYSTEMIEEKIKMVKTYDFKTVNIDLIFSYPGQSEEELVRDLNKVSQLSVDQVTTYPLLTFPYTAVGEFMKINQVKMPRLLKRRKFYRKIYDFFHKKNFKMTSVWGFKRGAPNQYSSVTRARYIGLGAGAGSRLEKSFYFNTFSIDAYENRLLSEEKLPIAVDMEIDKNLAKMYWLYWKLYETRIPFEEYEQMANRKIRCLLFLFKLFGFCHEESQSFVLTKRGAFWIHWVQNHFVLEYINKVWNRMKQKAFPDAIDF